MRSSCLLRIVRSFGSSKELLTPKLGILLINISWFRCSKRKQKIISIMKSLFEFGTISGGGCGGQHMDAKSILTVVSQISASRHHLYTLFVAALPIFGRETANWSRAYHYETPCNKKFLRMHHLLVHNAIAHSMYVILKDIGTSISIWLFMILKLMQR